MLDLLKRYRFLIRLVIGILIQPIGWYYLYSTYDNINSVIQRETLPDYIKNIMLLSVHAEFVAVTHVVAFIYIAMLILLFWASYDSKNMNDPAIIKQYEEWRFEHDE